MSILSIILIAIGAIIVLILIIAAMGKNDFILQTEAIINKPKQEVYNYIKFLKNSEHYNKWVMTDPSMKKDFKGTDGTVGFAYGWDSENKSVGKGEQEITKLKEGERVDYEIRFKKPFEGTSYAWIELEPVSEKQTKVKWSFSSTNTYMMKVMHIVLNLKKVLTKDLLTSLNNLKNILEK